MGFVQAFLSKKGNLSSFKVALRFRTPHLPVLYYIYLEVPGKPIYHVTRLDPLVKQIYRELEVFWERVLVVSGAVDVNELKSLDPKSGENGDASPTQARPPWKPPGGW